MIFHKEYFDNLIKDSEKYYAHISPEKSSFAPELLSEHSSLTVNYAQRLSMDNGLEGIIKNLIHDSLGESTSPSMESFVSNLFWTAIAYHDLGKLNEKFQRDKMRNNHRFITVNHPFGSDHSVVSVYLYLAVFFCKYLEIENKLREEDKIRICNIALYFSYNIKQHHSALLSECQSDGTWNDERLFSLAPYISNLNIT